MNRLSHLLLLSVLLLLAYPASSPLCAQEKSGQTLPDYPQAHGVSAPFAGFIGEKLIVAGGCNFPDIPAADGGKKVFYNTAFILNLAPDTVAQWVPLADLPQALAYGASVSTPYGLACIGGQNRQGPTTDAFLLQTDGSITPLPALPAPIDNGGAALIGHTVYATGGNQPDGAKALYALDLESPIAWKRSADYPGLQRVQPIVLASPNALYLIGGYAFDATLPLCTPSTDMLKYDPTSDTWSQVDSLKPEKDGTPRCLAGGSGVYKNGCLYLTGGVHHDIFKQAMEGRAPTDYMRKAPEWYRFNDDLLIYDLQQHTWQIIPDLPNMARAGGILLEHQSTLYMICGEIKPGIRTSQITTNNACLKP